MAVSMASQRAGSTGIYSLPNELLSSLLTPFPTEELLPLTRVSHRLNALVLRILHRRLLATAPLSDYRLILECYHPSAKATEPYLVCTYRGTESFDRQEGDIYYEPDGLRKLRTLYSRFKPHKKDGELRLGGRRMYGRTVLMTDVADNRLLAEAIFRQTAVTDDEPGKVVSKDARPIQTVMLDTFENFSQLCVSANILGRGAFTTCVTLADGNVRVSRDWLAQQVSSAGSTRGDRTLEPSEDSRILWVDPEKTAGLKVRVQEVTNESQTPVLVHQDEDVAVTYEVELEELLVRTTRLLMAVEEAREADVAPKAIIVGSVQFEPHH